MKSSKKAVVVKPVKEINWYLNTSIAEDKTGLLSVIKFNPKTKYVKLVLDEFAIPYIPSTLSDVITLALQQEITSAAEKLMKFYSSWEEAKDAVINAPATEKKVYNWYKSIDMNDLVIWIDFYGQPLWSEEDSIEVKRFYQLEQEAEEQLMKILEIEGEDNNE